MIKPYKKSFERFARPRLNASSKLCASRKLFASLSLILSIISSLPNPVLASEIQFASKQLGSKLLSKDDDFLKRLSPFDKAIRLKDSTVVSDKAFKKHLRSSVLSWSQSEKEKIRNTSEDILIIFDQLKLVKPKKIIFIKTNGSEEAGTAYTRGESIILPKSTLTTDGDLKNLLTHELFHLISRAHPKRQEKAYRALGFVKHAEIKLNSHYQAIRVTNPDSPIDQYSLPIEIEGERHWLAPILFAKYPRDEDVSRHSFFSSIELTFIETAKSEIELKDLKGKILPSSLSQIYSPQTIIHQHTYPIDKLQPEEILANYFVALIKRARKGDDHLMKGPNSELITQLRSAFTLAHK